MNAPHLHLLLNHVPTIGTVIAVGIFLLSFLRKNEGLRRVSLELFCIVGLATLPAYLSGVGAQAILELEHGGSTVLIERHHDAALWGALFMVLTAGAAWLALWQMRRLSHPSRGALASVLLLSTLTVAAMGRAANLGGDIRHPEILFDPEAAEAAATAAGPAWLTAASVAKFVTGRTWVWPTSEALHFIGLWMLFGIVMLINLRMLGMIKSASFAAVHRLLPWAVLGLGVNLITGMMFVIGAPGQYMENVAFFWKMGLLLLAGLNVLYLTVFDGPWELGPGEDAPLIDKAMAACALASWVGVMYCGRMLPFIGNAF
jgi:hypothetical protein